jgi:hypothetical protein
MWCDWVDRLHAHQGLAWLCSVRVVFGGSSRGHDISGEMLRRRAVMKPSWVRVGRVVGVVEWSKWTGRERPVRAIGSGKRRGCGPSCRLGVVGRYRSLSVAAAWSLIPARALPCLPCLPCPCHPCAMPCCPNTPTTCPTQCTTTICTQCTDTDTDTSRPIDAAGPPLQPFPLVLHR